MSAPSFSGCWKIGVAKTLSTMTLAPTACAISLTARMSVISSTGLDGVSISTALVLGRIAASQALGSVASTKVVSTPKRGSHSEISQRHEPNRARPATTWSPARTRPIRAAWIEAMPVAWARQTSAPSSSARRSSNIFTVGLLNRE
jgi:hypothetical protein